MDSQNCHYEIEVYRYNAFCDGNTITLPFPQPTHTLRHAATSSFSPSVG
jgi:hypothetical protein